MAMHDSNRSLGQMHAGDEEVVVAVRHVSKKFCRTLKRSMAYGILDLVRDFAGLRRDSTTLRKDEFWALDDVSFELRRGEALGLIGANGSGKTTLFRLLAGILPPDKGEIILHGRVGALIAVGAGFHPHMTGRENIYLNGAILGMTRAEVDDQFEDIVAFAEIGSFIDAPVSTYSSGMRVRLGFAIATAIQPDILLLDEILAVGDVSFRRRCFERMERLLDEAAVILVSHNMAHIEELCTRAIYLDAGQIREEGAVTQVTNTYTKEMHRRSARFSRQSNEERAGSGEIRFTELDVYGDRSGSNEISYHGERLHVEAHFRCYRPMRNIRFIVGLYDLTFGALLAVAECYADVISADGSLACEFQVRNLLPHAYSVALGITDLRLTIDLWRHAREVIIVGDDSTQAWRQELIRIPHRIQVTADGVCYTSQVPSEDTLS